MMTMIILILFALIIKIVYKIKLSDALEGFTDGMKKMLPTVCLVILAYSILVSSYNNGFMETIVTKAGDFNLGITSLVTLLGSLLNVDLYYTASSEKGYVLKRRLGGLQGVATAKKSILSYWA